MSVEVTSFRFILGTANSHRRIVNDSTGTQPLGILF